MEKPRTIYTITINGITYRFTDCLDHGTHWSGRMILDNGKVGRMVHKITLDEMVTATKEQEEEK